MGMIKIYSSKSKPAKKKPGWQKQEAEYQAWLKSVQSMGSGIRTSGLAPKKRIEVVVSAPVVDETRGYRGSSLQTPGGAATKPVHRPEIMYKDDPEMLERELRARERRFTTAPAYNKGGNVLITDEMMKDITAGKTRRR